MNTITEKQKGHDVHEIVRSLNGDDKSFQLKLTSQVNIHRLNAKVNTVINVDTDTRVA